MPGFPYGRGRTQYLPVGNTFASVELRWPDKGVGDTLPYVLDATAFLADIPDVIAAGSVTIASSPPGLVINAISVLGGAISCTIGGGTISVPLADYAVTITFQTGGGFTVQRSVWLRVWPLSPNKTFSTDLLVIQGAPGRGIAGIAADAAGANVVITYDDLTTQTVPSADLFAAESAALLGEQKIRAAEDQNLFSQLASFIKSTQLALAGVGGAMPEALAQSGGALNLVTAGGTASTLSLADMSALQVSNGSGATLTLMQVAAAATSASLGGVGTGASTSVFTSADVAVFAAMSRDADAVRRIPNTTAQTPSASLNALLMLGQSHAIAQQGGPAITTQQQFDTVTMGPSSRGHFLVLASPGSNDGIYESVNNDPTLHPAVGTVQAQIGTSDLIQMPTGFLGNLQGVIVTTASGSSTVSWSAGGASAVGQFPVGSMVDFWGFPVAQANNNSNGQPGFTVSAVAATSITVSPGLVANAAPVNGVSIAAINLVVYGEDMSIGATTQLRLQQLVALNANADPTRRLVALNLSTSGTSASQNLPGGSPIYWNRVPQALAQLQSTAQALGAGSTASLFAVVWAQGGGDQFTSPAPWVSSNGVLSNAGPVANVGLNTAGYLAELQLLQASVIGAASVNLGQTRPPLLLLIPPPAEDKGCADFDALGLDKMPVPQAYAEFAGLCPDLGITTPATPDVVLVAPMSGQVPDRGPHYFANGYRLYGNMIGKVLGVLRAGQTWRPLYPIAAVFRGTEVFLTFSVPVPPIQFGPVYFRKTLLTLLTQGISVTDDTSPVPGAGTMVPITAVMLASGTGILVQLGRPLASNPYVWFGAAGDPNVRSRLSICDSDPTVSADTYAYQNGVGFTQVEQSFAAVGSRYPLNNYCIQRAMRIVPG